MAVALSGLSNRRSALRLLESKPWQAKQLSVRIGRMSRLNRTGELRAAGSGAGSPARAGATKAPAKTAVRQPRTVNLLLSIRRRKAFTRAPKRRKSLE